MGYNINVPKLFLMVQYRGQAIMLALFCCKINECFWLI